MCARGACNAVNEVRDFSQLQSFQSVRASFGSQMDVERIQKGGLLLSIVLFKICFAFVESRAVFLDCVYTTLSSDGRDLF